MVLIVLDVDSILDRLPNDQSESAVMVRQRDARNFPIWADPMVIAALDVQVQRPSVQLGWLTTWGEDVDRLVSDAFGGKLDGGYEIAERNTAREKKMRRGKK